MRRPDRRGVDQRRDAPAVGTESTISLARTVSGSVHCRVSGNSSRATSCPSARRHRSTPSNCSGARSGVHRPSTIRRALRLSEHRIADPGIEDHHTHRRDVDEGLQVRPGSLLPRCLRALAMPAAACDANSTRTSWFWPAAPSRLPSTLRRSCPHAPRGDAGCSHHRLRPHQVRENQATRRRRAGRSASLRPAGPRRARRAAALQAQSTNCWCSTGVRPEVTNSTGLPPRRRRS